VIISGVLLLCESEKKSFVRERAEEFFEERRRVLCERERERERAEEFFEERRRVL
jgi:hypothetical protein